MDCTECDYVFADVAREDLRPRLEAAARGFKSLMSGTSTEVLRRRPAEAVWSPLEYTCHTRDVLWNLRDRILLALVEDRPAFAPIYREHRVDLGRYNDEPPEQVGSAVQLGAGLLAWLVEGLTDEQLTRTGVYAGEDRDVLWIARQALHEASHHLADAAKGTTASTG